MNPNIIATIGIDTSLIFVLPNTGIFISSFTSFPIYSFILDSI